MIPRIVYDILSFNKKINEIKFKNKKQNNVTDDLKKSLINYITLTLMG